MKANLFPMLFVLLVLLGIGYAAWRVAYPGNPELTDENYKEELDENFRILLVALANWDFANKEYPGKLSDMPLDSYPQLINPYTGNPAIEIPIGHDPSPGDYLYIRTDAASCTYVEPFSDNESVVIEEFFPNGGYYLFVYVKSGGMDINFDGTPDGLVGPIAECQDGTHYHIGTCSNMCPRPLIQVLERLDETHPDLFKKASSANRRKTGHQSSLALADMFQETLELCYDPAWPTDKQIEDWIDANPE